MMLYLVFLLFFFIAMIGYFKTAERYKIIDKPNERSSHTELTIRGGGIIYLFAALCIGVLHPQQWMPILGIITIGTISFIDDRITLSSKIRILVHLAAVSLLFYGLDLFQILPWWGAILLYIVVIGVINAYNFMDGINGITGVYTLVVLSGLQYVNLVQVEFVNPDMIWLPLLATVVFLYFNFRKRAKCFAGDVGSVSVAFWIIWLMLELMIKTESFQYILFLAVYGVDAILTIIHRLMLRQNIFEAHRLHFYQILANDQKVPHLVVSTAYGLLQLIIIVVVILGSDFSTLFLLTIIPLSLIYILVKPKLMIKR